MEENKSFLEIQKTIDKFINKHGGYWPPLSMFAALVEEIGELARELNHLEKHKTKKLGKPFMVTCFCYPLLLYWGFLSFGPLLIHLY